MFVQNLYSLKCEYIIAGTKIYNIVVSWLKLQNEWLFE